MNKFATLALVLVGCVKAVTIDANERTLTPPPSVVFDPLHDPLSLPRPTDLVFSDKTGKLAIPPLGVESPLETLLRTQGFNELDGYSTVLPGIMINFTAPIDAASLTGHIFLYRIETDGVPSDPATEPAAPLVVILAKQTQVIAEPEVPLAGHSVYVVALTEGITSGGANIDTSGTFALLRQRTPPATVDAQGNVLTNNLPFDPSVPAQLSEIQQFAALWAGTAPVLQYLDAVLPRALGAPFDRSQLVLAYPFHTQSISQALDQSVTGSAGAQVLTESTALSDATEPGLPATTAPAIVSFVEGIFGSGTCGTANIGAIDCADMGEIHEESFTSPNFQVLVSDVPGAWSDPLQPTKVSDEKLDMLVVLPTGAYTDTVIFGHGLGGRKEDMLYVAGQLAAQGYATVAIDWVASGERAVQNSTDPALGCAGPVSSLPAQCFAPIFSTDLLGTRDNFRQSVIDVEQEARVVKACAANVSCAVALHADHLGYVGQSLGGLLGVMVAAETPQIGAAVIDVGGAGWIDLATLTPDPGIKCSIVNGLIDGGILTGTKFDGTNYAAALCSSTSWLTDPNFLSFRSAAQWILDPADGLNYAAHFLAPTATKILLQEVDGDQTVPNPVQDNLGALARLVKTTSNTTAPISPALPVATSSVTLSGNDWVDYFSDSHFTYSHASLIVPTPVPADPTAATNGHNQLIVDAIAYLKANL